MGWFDDWSLQKYILQASQTSYIISFFEILNIFMTNLILFFWDT